MEGNVDVREAFFTESFAKDASATRCAGLGDIKLCFGGSAGADERKECCSEFRGFSANVFGDSVSKTSLLRSPLDNPTSNFDLAISMSYAVRSFAFQFSSALFVRSLCLLSESPISYPRADRRRCIAMT